MDWQILQMQLWREYQHQTTSLLQFGQVPIVPSFEAVTEP